MALLDVVEELLDDLAILGQSLRETRGGLDHEQLVLLLLLFRVLVLFGLHLDQFLLVAQVGEPLEPVHLSDEDFVILFGVVRMELFFGDELGFAEHGRLAAEAGSCFPCDLFKRLNLLNGSVTFQLGVAVDIQWVAVFLFELGQQL